MNEWLTDPDWQFWQGRELQPPPALGRQLLRRLRLLESGPRPWGDAARQHYRLLVMGYVVHSVGDDADEVIITAAGRACLLLAPPETKKDPHRG